MTKYMRYAVLTLLAALLATSVSAQQTVNTTTLSAALSAPFGTGANGSNTAVGPVNLFAVGSTSNIVVGYEIFVDQEAMLVQAIPVAGTVQVQRGYDATRPASHLSGAVVYIGASSAVPGSPFQYVDPSIGSCTATNELFTLRINVLNGKAWQCTNGVWLNVIDSYALIGPGNCFFSTTSGTLATPAAVTNINVYSTTSTGLINAGATAPGTPVMQVATTNSGTATNTISCLVPVPSRANTSRGVYVVDATWAYGVQQNALGTQAVTLASGLMNGVLAFGQITLPAAGASETPSTVAQARWDSGTMVLTPAVASFNTATTTAGAFATEKITPANPIAMATDLTSYYVNFTVLCQATTATTLNVAGVLIHYRTLMDL